MKPDHLESVSLETNGIRLHAVLSGPADGPLVILLHGFPEFWYGWRHQIEPLAQAGFRVLAPDQRGYNLSDKPKGLKAYRLEALSQDVIGLLYALGREKCHLVGHDWGAAVAWHTAIQYPQYVTKLGILNVPHPQVMLNFIKHNPQQMLKSWYIGFFQIPGLADWLLSRRHHAAAVQLLAKSGKPGTFTDQDLLEYRKAYAQPGAMTSMIHWYRALLRYPPAAPADYRLHMPTLILWGKQDLALSEAMAQPSAEMCDDVKLVLYEEATHWVQHNAAQEVSAALVEFLML